MVDVPSATNAAEKFARRGQAAQQDYEAGVEGASDSDWQQGSESGAQNWASGVQDAIANDAFARGVRNPSASWKERTLELGTGRFGQGIQASQGKYATAIQPFFDALEALSLPPRGPRGSGENFNRSQTVGQRLHELRGER